MGVKGNVISHVAQVASRLSITGDQGPRRVVCRLSVSRVTLVCDDQPLNRVWCSSRPLMQTRSRGPPGSEYPEARPPLLDQLDRTGPYDRLVGMRGIRGKSLLSIILCMYGPPKEHNITHPWQAGTRMRQASPRSSLFFVFFFSVPDSLAGAAAGRDITLLGNDEWLSQLSLVLSHRTCGLHHGGASSEGCVERVRRLVGAIVTCRLRTAFSFFLVGRGAGACDIDFSLGIQLRGFSQLYRSPPTETPRAEPMVAFVFHLRRSSPLFCRSAPFRPQPRRPVMAFLFWCPRPSARAAARTSRIRVATHADRDRVGSVRLRIATRSRTPPPAYPSPSESTVIVNESESGLVVLPHGTHTGSFRCTPPFPPAPRIPGWLSARQRLVCPPPSHCPTGCSLESNPDFCTFLGEQSVCAARGLPVEYGGRQYGHPR